MKRKKYTEEFRRDAVRALRARGTKTADEIAAQYGIAPSMLYRWQEQFPDAGENEAHAGEVESLRQRVRTLEQENAILKKAAAFFARSL